MSEEKTASAGYDCPPRTFVLIWERAALPGGGGIDEVAEKTGMPVGICHDRASKYRAKGIQLSSMPRKRRGRPPLDIESLNELIERVKQGQSAGEGSEGSDEVVVPPKSGGVKKPTGGR
jgi:hypothetical protein